MFSKCHGGYFWNKYKIKYFLFPLRLEYVIMVCPLHVNWDVYITWYIMSHLVLKSIYWFLLTYESMPYIFIILENKLFWTISFLFVNGSHSIPLESPTVVCKHSWCPSSWCLLTADDMLGAKTNSARESDNESDHSSYKRLQYTIFLKKLDTGNKPLWPNSDQP